MVLLDVQSGQIGQLNGAVKNLQHIAQQTYNHLHAEIAKSGMFINILLNTMSLNAAAQLFTKAHVILSDIKLQISDIRSYFNSALNNKLSSKLIPPAMLQELLQNCNTELKEHQSLLWGLDKSSVITYYNQVETTIHQASNGHDSTSMISFRIPIVDSQHAFIHKQINALPFLTFQGRSTHIVKINDLPSQVDILVKTGNSSMNQSDQYFRVDAKGLSKENVNNIAATLNTRELHTVTSTQQLCIESILAQNVNRITTNCDIVSTDITFEMNKVSETKYIYFAQNSTNITVNCPLIDPKEEKMEQILSVTNFGTIHAPAVCDVKSPYTTFVGLPIQLQQTLVHLPRATQNRMNNFQSLNTTLWINIIQQQHNMQLAEIHTIITDIIEITRQFQPDTLYNVSVQLNKELKDRLQLAKHADLSAWEAIINITTRKSTLSIFMMIGLVAVCCTSIYLIIKLIAACRSRPTIYSALVVSDNKSPEDIVMSTCTKQVDDANDFIYSRIVNHKLSTDADKRYAAFVSGDDSTFEDIV